MPDLTEDDDSPEPASSRQHRVAAILALIIIGLLAVAAAVIGVVHQLSGHPTSAQAHAAAQAELLSRRGPGRSEQLAEAQ